MRSVSCVAVAFLVRLQLAVSNSHLALWPNAECRVPIFSSFLSNSELNRRNQESSTKIVEFCPKSANFSVDQGSKQGFQGISLQPTEIRRVAIIRAATLSRRTGNAQGICVTKCDCVPPSRKQAASCWPLAKRTASWELAASSLCFRRCLA